MEQYVENGNDISVGKSYKHEKELYKNLYGKES